MRTVIQGSGRSLDEHAAPLRADRLRVVDHPAFVAGDKPLYGLTGMVHA